jgi:hypothetical protein
MMDSPLESLAVYAASAQAARSSLEQPKSPRDDPEKFCLTQTAIEIKFSTVDQCFETLAPNCQEAFPVTLSREPKI